MELETELDILTFVCGGVRRGLTSNLYQQSNLQENLPLETLSCRQRKGRHFCVPQSGGEKAREVTRWGNEDLFNLGVEREEKNRN